MITYYSTDAYSFPEGAGVGLGNFDGVHKAHEVLIRKLVEESHKRGIPSVIYTFREHPGNILQHRKIKLISTLEKRIERFGELGIDYLVLEEFNAEYAKMEAVDFINGVLAGKLNSKLVVTGFNYFFGKDGRGDTGLLSKSGKKLGFETMVLDPVKVMGMVVSSSAIREFINDGNMEMAREMLGSLYSIKGTVEYGNRIGTLIGFPTANIIPTKDYALPSPGVYFTMTDVDGRKYHSITNIGFRPTVDSIRNEIIETHIFDFSGWLYGREIDVSFISKHRDELKHGNIDELKNQIEDDIKEAREFFGRGFHL